MLVVQVLRESVDSIYSILLESNWVLKWKRCAVDESVCAEINALVAALAVLDSDSVEEQLLVFKIESINN